ncbi:retrovirus-related pol polyprotein from transposon TNT 1-94 [Tanacetum coccineum]
MANLSEDIQCASSNTRPPMLDRTDFASWKHLLKELKATNILLQGLPKGIYTLINHYTNAKDIWDNVKMLLEGETIHDYYVRFAKLINDMRNIKMTMSRMQLNSKFVNNMLPEWGRFVTAVKRNRGLRDSNYDQLYAYLKQHEAHANENKMMLDRFTQHTVDPLALLSNVSHQQYYLQSSITPPSIYVPPHFVDNTQLDSGLSLTDNLIENLTNTLALLTQSYKTYLPQINNQLRTSSNTRNQATVQDDRVVVQNIQGRQNRGQGNNAQGVGTIGYGGAQNRVGNANPGQARQIKQDVADASSEMGGKLDEDQFTDLALNVDNVFQADDCDAFDSDVDEAPMAQTMFMANLSSADPVYDEAVRQHEMHDDVQPNYVVDSHANYTSDSNMIPYDQYVKDNPVPVVQSNVSYVPNDAYMMVFNDMHELHPQSISDTTRNTVVDSSLTVELATYKEQVELYERRVRFELTKREQKIDEQLRIVITDRNIKEENLKKELHSVKLQLASTINHNKSMVEEVTSLKKDFKQKENKYLEEFLDMKALKEKVEDKLYKQDQSLQTVHMLCKPKPYYDELNKVAIGYKNPLCLTRAKQVQPALYNGHEIIKTNHVPALVHNTEDTLEIAEITRKKMNDKMKDPECVTHKVKIAPPDYSKENYLATFTPQKQLTPEQIFWSQDLIKMKAEALKKQTTASRPIKALTVYPPNTPATLVPRVLPTKSQVKINIFALIQLFLEFDKTCKKRITPTGLTEGERGFEQTKECYLTEVIPFFKTLKEHFEGIQKALTKEIKEMKDIFEELEAEVDQNVVDRKHDEIERKNLLIANDNLIADCLSKEVFYVATNSELNVSRFTEMHDAHTIVKARCLELEVELSNLRDKIQKDNHNELVIQIVLWYLDSGCSKHMTGDRSRLKNFMKKFIGTVRFWNDHFGAIMGYGYYVIGDSVIFREDMMKSSPIFLLSKASKNKSWLWHRRLNHFNFGTINDLARKDLVRGLPRLKFEKDHLCSACQLGKSKKHTHKPKTENTNLEVLHTLHMDLCGPMQVQTINEKKYILVIIDDYLRFTWVKFLRSKDENPEVVIKFLKQIQVGLNKTVRYIRTDNGTEFVNKDLTEYYERVSIFHQKSVPRTPQQNDVVERRNHTLVEAARTMLIFSKALMFLWAEAVATACYTQNRSLIHTRHNKTPYELVHDKKPDLTFFRVFGALCYPTNDSEDLGKLQPTADIGIFVGYAPSRKGYRIYKKRTRRIMETIHVQFDELTEQIAPVQLSTGPAPTFLTHGQISSGLVPNPVPAATYGLPTNKELEILFQPMFDEYLDHLRVKKQVSPAPAVPVPVNSAGTPSSTTIDQDAPSPSHSPSSSAL